MKSNSGKIAFKKLQKKINSLWDESAELKREGASLHVVIPEVLDLSSIQLEEYTDPRSIMHLLGYFLPSKLSKGY